MRPDQLHVAQQIRRDKLRIQNQEFPNNNIEQLLSLHQTSQPAGFNNLDLLHLRNANNNMLDDHDQEGLYSSNQMINSFSTPSNPLHRNPLEYYYENHEINPNSFLPTSEIHNNDIFKSSTSISSHSTSEMASLMNHHGIWGGGNSNSPTVPVCHENEANLWTNRGVTVVDNSNMGSFFSDCNPQGLSLSLSSNSQSKPSASSSNFEQGSLNVVKPTTLISRDSTCSSSGFRNVGPLGPFTGYATILKNSRYLKPCQELLEECCCFVKSFENNNNNVPKWVSRDVVGCSSSGGVDEKGSSNSGGSSSMLYGSKEKENSGDGGIGNNFCLSSSASSSRPECQKNKAQLLYMHDEVTRRYKQYHQQMQMVVSSFESVAGLSSATPYISLALKSLSRHFRCLKNAITDQLKLTCQVLGEDFSILPTTTSSSNKFDSNNNNMTRLRCMNHHHSLQKNKSGGNSNVDFVEPQQQHVWRPQRGLPERSVAILKAWLFEHFLHPYPTDTDKHMLATQTGLSRNQVSNWFINARVRVWKPMVEEIHMLESKGTAEAQNQNNDKNEACRVGTHEKQFQCLEMGSSSGINNVEKVITNEEQWINNLQEKSSKLESDQITPNIDSTVMGFMPYQRGSVSLTLGLRHGVESVQQQQQQLQQDVELRHQFGEHMIHDFVG
ncbi:putative transcription factor Homeodomain-TALE-BEL family [Medicago truncatula]|uniref:Putative transcription factor Homeodomain-TALE-BEL family n=1 Tax=Medicago truncatula TaxID=3880 RepID=A0A396I7I3_MEDTR|nr:BEL1-like homeodomain protein 8 [Medicago truncatula]XP_039688676.1 BEL1-like homeodomain protein 8 [Medicago truncatula]RHN60701.1 putative transcription factor Homeodomain-TALE-BEL family [Medicago truncatula]